MQEVWFFAVADPQDAYLAHASCDFMGMYAPLMNAMAQERIGYDWMDFTTFTQKDFDPKLHGDLGINVAELPLKRKRFLPQSGLEMLEAIRSRLLQEKSEFVENEWVREVDFEHLIVDFNSAIDVLEKGLRVGGNWYLDVKLV
jgi:hypothetical protein